MRRTTEAQRPHAWLRAFVHGFLQRSTDSSVLSLPSAGLLRNSADLLGGAGTVEELYELGYPALPASFSGFGRLAGPSSVDWVPSSAEQALRMQSSAVTDEWSQAGLSMAAQTKTAVRVSFVRVRSVQAAGALELGGADARAESLLRALVCAVESEGGCDPRTAAEFVQAHQLDAAVVHHTVVSDGVLDFRLWPTWARLRAFLQRRARSLGVVRAGAWEKDGDSEVVVPMAHGALQASVIETAECACEAHGCDPPAWKADPTTCTPHLAGADASDATVSPESVRTADRPARSSSDLSTTSPSTTSTTNSPASNLSEPPLTSSSCSLLSAPPVLARVSRKRARVEPFSEPASSAGEPSSRGAADTTFAVAVAVAPTATAVRSVRQRAAKKPFEMASPRKEVAPAVEVQVGARGRTKRTRAPPSTRIPVAADRTASEREDVGSEDLLRRASVSSKEDADEVERPCGDDAGHTPREETPIASPVPVVGSLAPLECASDDVARPNVPTPRRGVVSSFSVSRAMPTRPSSDDATAEALALRQTPLLPAPPVPAAPFLLRHPSSSHPLPLLPLPLVRASRFCSIQASDGAGWEIDTVFDTVNDTTVLDDSGKDGELNDNSNDSNRHRGGLGRGSRVGIEDAHDVGGRGDEGFGAMPAMPVPAALRTFFMPAREALARRLGAQRLARLAPEWLRTRRAPSLHCAPQAAFLGADGSVLAHGLLAPSQPLALSLVGPLARSWPALVARVQRVVLVIAVDCE